MANIKMNQQKLLKLVQTLVTLKEKLKCPICLDVMQEVIELDCGHKYCEECYNEHKSTQKQVACPLCKKLIKRRSMVYKDSYANVLGKFVHNSCKSIQSTYKCEVEQLQRTLCTDTDPTPQVQTDILKQNVRSNTITKTVKLSTSKSKDRMRKSPDSKENCEDAFDKLMKSALAPSAFNRNATRRTYVNKKKADKKTEYNILEFDNNENKTVVVQWLNDTRNLFDRLTQTQSFEEERMSPAAMDLPSISQKKEHHFKSTTKIVRKSRAKSLDIEIRNPIARDPKRHSDGGRSENYNIEEINTEEEEVIKKVEEKVLLDLIEEEFLNKLDKELQNNTGQSNVKKKARKSGMQGNTPSSATSAAGWDRITKIKKTIKKSEKVPRQLNITLQSNQNLTPKSDNEVHKPKPVEKNITTDNSDVSKRVLKVALPKISIEKNQMSKKNLETVLQSVDKSKQVRNVRNEIDTGQDKIEFLEKIDLSHVNEESEFKAPDSVETAKNRTIEKPVSYDFNKLEDYITKNMKLMDKSLDSTSSAHTTLQPQKTVNKDIEFYVVNEHTGKVKECHKVNVHINNCPSTAQNEAQTQTRDDRILFEDEDVLFNMPTQKILNTSDHTTSKAAIVIDNVGEITDKSITVVQGSNAKSKRVGTNEVFTIKLDDIIGDEETCVPIGKKSGHDHRNSASTSNTALHHNNGDTTEKGDYDIDELYALPTQKIKHTCSNDVTANFEALIENSGSTKDLLQLFEENLSKRLASLRSMDVVDVENHLHNLQILVAKFKSLNEEATNESVKVASTNVCSIATQTFVEKVDEKVQTEDKCTNNAEVQTEDVVHCSKCNGDLNNVNVEVKVVSQGLKTAMESIVSEPNVSFKPSDRNMSKRNTPTSKQPSQNEMFTATFDNLNFETQELTKNQGVVLRNSGTKSDTNLHKNLSMRSNKEVLSVGADRSGDNLPGSVLVCSLDSTNPTSSKKAKKRLTYDQDTSKRFKRIRPPTSDSDSDTEVKAKRKCNRFVRDDLTIEIHTNTERTEGQEHESALESQNSDNINYDEYLAEVMKKYEDGNFSTNSSDKTSKTPLSRKEVINDMVTKCEEMIQHANKNIENIKKINNVTLESSAESFETASQSINNNIDDDNMFMDERNLLKLESDIKAYEKSSVKEPNSEISDIIGATEELEPLPKRLKYNTARRENPQSASLFSSTKTGGYVNQELNDNLDDVNFGIIEEQTNSNKAISPSKGNVKIIENIKIKSQNRNQDIREEEDDLFSDEDIVETTPQKKVGSFAERSILSQIEDLANVPIRGNLPTPLSNTENFEFDFEALPPPPDFQDDIPSSDNNAAIIPPSPEASIADPDIATTDFHKSSATPDMLSQIIVNESNRKDDIPSCTPQYNNDEEDQGQNILSLTPDKLSQLDINPEPRDMMHNTPVTQRNLAREGLGISPIPARKSQLSGIIEMTETSKYTPLSSITRTSEKHTILTSTPKQKSIWNYIRPSQSTAKEETTPITKTKPCIACTRLTKDQIKTISQLTGKKLATYSANFDSGVTHMIVAVNEDHHVRDYTIKFVSAVAAGIWVLRFDWIEECLRNSCIVPEEPYEALDISGMPGPRTSRLTRKKNPLFKGYKFYCANPFINTTRQEVEGILKMLEGKVLRDMKDLLEEDGNIGLIIGEGHGTQDFEQYERWFESYKTVTVDIEWLSKCVGQYKIISIRPYVWCSEDNLGDLGYPPYLTETVPLSFTETF